MHTLPRGLNLPPVAVAPAFSAGGSLTFSSIDMAHLLIVFEDSRECPQWSNAVRRA